MPIQKILNKVTRKQNETKQNRLAKFESLIFKINLGAVSSKVNS